jgi:hypothetical protein
METERRDEVETEVDRGLISFLETLTAFILVAVLFFPIFRIIYNSI